LGHHWGASQKVRTAPVLDPLAMYTPLLYALNIIALPHPFGVYASGMTPESMATSTSLRFPADEDDGYKDEKEDLIPT
jgi:hypothetical protein